MSDSSAHIAAINLSLQGRSGASNSLGTISSTSAARVMSLDDLQLLQGRSGIANDAAHASHFARDQLAGRLIELSAVGASAILSAVVGLVLEVQKLGEPVVWLSRGNATFYPPDVAASGVDLASLVVVRTPDGMATVRAAERLLRSGAFGLVVMDLGRDAVLPMAVQGRMVTLAQQHDAVVVCLTEKSTDSASLGSLVSMRVEATRLRREGSFSYTLRALKDKRRGPGWSESAVLRPLEGMR